jgi:hypothetical protein
MMLFFIVFTVGMGLKLNTLDSNKMLAWLNNSLKSDYKKLTSRGRWKMSSCKASEIPRNEAYVRVRRSDEG